MLELAEEALDEIALSVERGVDRSLDFAVALGRNVSLTAALANEIDQKPPVIAAICDDDGRAGQSFQQSRSGGLV